MESTLAELRSIRQAHLEVTFDGKRGRIGRRREQNRLNQRACRLRKRIQNSTEESQSSASIDTTPYGVLVPSKCTGSTSNTVTTPYQTDEVVHLSLQLPNWVILTQLNVWQATLINSLILGMSHFFTDEDHPSDNHDNDDEEDPAYTPHYLSPPLSLKSPLPPSLHPTLPQQRTPHYPWIDLFPDAGMRDKLIQASPRLDVHDFCSDMLGSMLNHPSSSPSPSCSQTGAGFMVWGESWLVESWEMSEGFVRKYAWLLEDEGCEEVIRATNRWRERRGEELLVVK
ncbi:uncharacterized protein BHQ10_008924 [Talaromyces amestolkiae]|uniref:BZIP domain-containing protein n=1 Tax=Talaromyces amestolkiae TaxID=1196081 RepID=A0A364LAT1_TALAM|nr:uncharacterized protein BHQ10_008924 [Talaromyces amestolkiae]RAO72912.1 hypothetical protein BHQ10_008924 [Talaromyces amestolkiae]